jgi:hypothetical protein
MNDTIEDYEEENQGITYGEFVNLNDRKVKGERLTEHEENILAQAHIENAELISTFHNLVEEAVKPFREKHVNLASFIKENYFGTINVSEIAFPALSSEVVKSITSFNLPTINSDLNDVLYREISPLSSIVTPEFIKSILPSNFSKISSDLSNLVAKQITPLAPLLSTIDLTDTFPDKNLPFPTVSNDFALVPQSVIISKKKNKNKKKILKSINNSLKEINISLKLINEKID